MQVKCAQLPIGRRGFTLLEILLVVLIAVLITMMAVPAYKKAQEKNRYMAASGVLVELGNGIQMVREQYPSVLVTNESITANSDINAITDAPTEANLGNWMQTNKYVNKIPFTSETYMGYSYRISTTAAASCATGCPPADSDAVACMTGDNLLSEYTCAWVDKFGILHNTNY